MSLRGSGGLEERGCLAETGAAAAAAVAENMVGYMIAFGNIDNVAFVVVVAAAAVAVAAGGWTKRSHSWM